MPEKRVERRLAAIVSADVAGYSRLMGIDEEATLSALKSHRRELIDPTIEKHGGRIVKTTGDGVLLEFGSVVDAVRCCFDVQQEMPLRNNATPVERRIQFRVGIHLGDVIVEGDDIFGDGVNVAARLEGIADAGGICISRAVRDQVQHKLDLQLEDLGRRLLKNIEEPVRAYRILRSRQAQPWVSQDSALPMPERPSVAIMPFRNLNGEAQNQFIADGIGLGIQTLLVQLSGIFFINACSHQRYQKGEVTAAEAARDMPVRYVLEGAVQRSGQRVRVSAQLTDLHDNAMIWADRYDRDLEDVFTLQDDVTREVISSLSKELMGGQLTRIWSGDLSGTGAWEYFLRGISHFYKFTKDDSSLARQMFLRIHELHPERSLGPGYIALTHWLDLTREWSAEPAESLRQAAEWAAKAIACDGPNDGLGHVIMGSVRLREGRHDEALALCQKGVACRANCPFALGQLAAVQNYCGDPRGAVKSAREALTVRLIYPPPLVNVLATAYRDSGELGLSIAAAREAARLDPVRADALATLCSDHVLEGNDVEARRVAEQILQIDPAFRVSSYTSNQPYRDGAKRSQIGAALEWAGLPA